METPPVIDGVLDDKCWEKAARLTDFRASVYRRPAREQTIVFICCDETHLYVAFHCLDSQPAKLHAYQRKRDGGMNQDDYVELEIDSLHTHRRDTDFDINVIGTQRDTVGSGKVEWKGDWQAAARVVKDGWIAEYAVPFAILDYPPGATFFGINFNRWCQRLSEYSTYAPPGIDVEQERIEDYAHLVGLHLPARKAGRPPLLLLHQLTSASGRQGTATFTGGLDAKFFPTSNLTALLTANPDFSTVQQDVEGIDFTYTERYLSDNRPFFTEGSSYFEDAWLYTRRIPQFDLGAKSYGRIGELSIGAYDAVRLGKRTDAGLQIGRDFGDTFTSVFSLVSKVEGSHENHVGNLRATWKNGPLNVTTSAARSSTTGPGGDGNRLNTSASYTSTHWGGSLGYQNTGGGFNPEDGYIAYTDLRGASGDIHYDARSATKLVQYWHMHLTGNTYRRHGGGLIEDARGIHWAITMRNGDAYRLELAEGRHPDPTTPAVIHTDRTVRISGDWDTRDSYESRGAAVTWGRVRGGPYLLVSPYLGLRLSDSLSLRLSTQFRMMNDDQGAQQQIWQSVFTLNYDITQEKGFGARLVQRPQGLNLSISYRQSVRRGADAFIILGDPNAIRTQPQLWAKMVFPL